MRTVGLRVLKNRLSEYVRIAAAGETVLISDRDRVVAELGPPHPSRAEGLGDAVLADAMRRGYLTPPLAATGPVPSPAGVAPLSEVLAELEEDRADR
ncbi:MAG: prevent-host-death protein [Actinobacteria bacterium]|nr:prevent-host-death protein [Actinomycetota bacterium]